MRISPDALLTGIVTAAVGAATAIATWKAGHRKARADIVTAIQEAAHQVIQDLHAELARIKAEREDERAAMHERHAQCERELSALRTEFVEMRAEFAAFREIHVGPRLL